MIARRAAIAAALAAPMTALLMGCAVQTPLPSPEPSTFRLEAAPIDPPAACSADDVRYGEVDRGWDPEDGFPYAVLRLAGVEPDCGDKIKRWWPGAPMDRLVILDVSPQTYTDLSAAAVAAGFELSDDKTALEMFAPAAPASDGDATSGETAEPTATDTWGIRAFVAKESGATVQLRLDYLHHAGESEEQNGDVYLYYFIDP